MTAGSEKRRPARHGQYLLRNTRCFGRVKSGLLGVESRLDRREKTREEHAGFFYCIPLLPDLRPAEPCTQTCLTRNFALIGK